MRLPLHVALEFASRRRYQLHQKVARAAVAAVRQAGYRGTDAWALRHADLPEPLVIRCVHLAQQPEELVGAPEAEMRWCQCGLEIGVSGAWCAPLSSARARRSVYREIVALPLVGGSGRERRSEALRRWNAGSAGKEG